MNSSCKSSLNWTNDRKRSNTLKKKSNYPPMNNNKMAQWESEKKTDCSIENSDTIKIKGVLSAAQQHWMRLYLLCERTRERERAIGRIVVQFNGEHMNQSKCNLKYNELSVW